MNAQFLVDPEGHKTVVVLPIEDFRALVERLEELEDFRLIEGRKSEPRIAVSSLEELLRRGSSRSARASLKDLRCLPKEVRGRAAHSILELASTPYPRGVEKVKGYEDTYRVRAGDYRIV